LIFSIRFTSAERSVEYLTTIPKLGEFYQASKLVDYAIHTLEQHSTFSPHLHLNLAQRFRVSQWIEPVFRQLIDAPLLTLSDDHISQLGFRVFVLLAHTHACIVYHHQSCAVRAPPVVHDAGCLDEKDCAKAWNHAWWGEAGKPGVALALVHPDHCLSGRDILAKLGGIRPGWQMDGLCLELTLSMIEGMVLEFNSRLVMEESFIQQAIDKLIMAEGKERMA
jgi:hypothetical protein